MRNRYVLALAIAVIALSDASGLEIDVLARLSGGTHVALEEGRGVGFQAAFSAGGTAQAITPSGFGGGLTLTWEYALPSPVRDLVSYRGHTGVRLGLFGLWRRPERDASPISLGVRVGILGSYLRYSDTQLRFVAPGFFVEPTAELRIDRPSWLTVGAALPLVWTRRADLQLSCEAGFAIEAGVRLPLRRGKQ